MIARDYRILLEFGDNFGDFDDRYRTSEADRLKFFEENKQRWGREWLVVANPTYGSFDSVAFWPRLQEVGQPISARPSGTCWRAERTEGVGGLRDSFCPVQAPAPQERRCRLPTI